MIKFNDKRDDAKIFMLCFNPKEYGFTDNKLITPLQCGAAINPVNTCETKDNTGDNISHLNWFFVETTGIYWIWKNVHSRYKGQMQYRRRIDIDSNIDLDEVFKEYDVICAEPYLYHGQRELPANTVEEGFAFSHNVEDLKRLEYIIKRDYPDYSGSYDKYIKQGDKLYYSNTFILPEEEYNKYCEFLFDLLFKWAQETRISAREDLIIHVTRNAYKNKYVKYGPNPDMIDNGNIIWQTELGGFLSERIFTLWINHNYKKFKEYPYIKVEGQMI